MNIYRLESKLGLYLALSCMIYGCYILITIRSFTPGIVPTYDGRDVPEAGGVVLAVLAAFLLILSIGAFTYAV